MRLRNIMDRSSNSSDHSPPLSENVGETWLQFWENEIGLVSGKNLGINLELNTLVEDKEIAARAVAFVVNSTRKGIVPLCADIAGLMRAKRSLERNVFHLKRENDVLRSSTSLSLRTSHSTSPTPPSLSSYTDKGGPQDQSYQDRYRPCSRCSQSSSVVSTSPKFDKANCYKLFCYQHSPASSHESAGQPTNSPCLGRPSVALKTKTLCTTQALVHKPPDEVLSLSTAENCSHSNDDRNNSLPENTAKPNEESHPVSSTASKEVQCILPQHTDRALEEQFIQTVKLNSKLAQDLGAARKEIEVLTGRLKELEMNQLAKECSEQFHYENEPQILDVTTTRHACNGYMKATALKRQSPPSLIYPTPLSGCKCSSCVETLDSVEDLTQYSDNFKDEPQLFTISNKLKIQLNDHVVIKGERTGYVRYIGHLDNIGQPNMLFVGLELDAPVGSHDGLFDGKRYFYCHKDHGLVLPVQDVICKVSRSSKFNSLAPEAFSHLADYLPVAEWIGKWPGVGYQ